MIGDAVVKMIAAVKNKKFNLESTSNPFSYFTTIAYHAFINRIKKEKKYRETINDYQEQVYGELIQEEKMYKNAPTKDYDKEITY
jgi:DNA-directed RNA polymerase specialized sigma24 family protein